MNTTLDIYVTERGGAYTTNQVRGNTGSCTSSAYTAARRLAEKLFGPALHGVCEVKEGNSFTTRWRITADSEQWASVSSDGVLAVSSFIAPCYTAVAKGPERGLLKVLDSLTEGQLLLPSVAAASSREEKDQALLQWLQACARSTPPKASLGVVFEKTIRRAVL